MLHVLGTASQAPTRYRNHNGYLLRWDAEGILFDPGEGTQRQMTLAGLASSAITRICVTHFHGDHCLGLPGVFGRLAMDQVRHGVDVYYPAGGQEYFDRLRHASVTDRQPDLRPHPVSKDGLVQAGPAQDGPMQAGPMQAGPVLRVRAARLDHRTETFGWRLEEPDGLRFLPDRLEQAGVRGPDIGRLRTDGQVTVGGRTVTAADVSEVRRGQSMAFIMDTRMCDAALALATGVDLLVCESTFLEGEAHLAERYGHLTAAQAALLASEAGARRLVLTHYSQRHPDESVYLAEAAPIFPETIVVKDLDVVAVPGRRP
ncbi:MAG: ribonuclease Z [Acidimicrobiales bacterium]